ncbi:MAG: hypothetical protein EBZ77_11710, partial [Chitinophagia bacterium]|nr:hypothetical protein [Chitinophagia bacterium]
MGIVYRQALRTSAVTFAGALLGMFVVWYSARYLVRQQLGFSRTITNQAVLLSQLFISGLNYTMVVYIHRFADDARKRNHLLTMCILLPVLLASVAIVPYLLFKQAILHHYQPADIPFLSRYYLWLPVYTVLFILQVMLEQYLGTQLKVAIAAFMREIVWRLINIALLVLYTVQAINFDWFIAGTVLSLAVPVAINFYLAVGRGLLQFKVSFRSFSRDEYIDLLRFSWFHFLLTASIILIGTLDINVLPYYDRTGVNAVAVYQIVVTLLSFIQIPSKAMISSTTTVLSHSYATNDMEKMRDIFTRSSVNITLATVFMAVLIGCNLNNIVAFINNGYELIVPLFFILVLGRLADLCTGMNDVVLSIAKYYKFNVYVSFFLVAGLFLLIKYTAPVYGITGVAW